MNCYGQKRCSMHWRNLTFSVEVCQGWVPIGDWLRPKEGKAGKSSRLPARNTSADGEEILPVTGRVLRPAEHPYIQVSKILMGLIQVDFGVLVNVARLCLSSLWECKEIE